MPLFEKNKNLIIDFDLLKLDVDTDKKLIILYLSKSQTVSHKKLELRYTYDNELIFDKKNVKIENLPPEEKPYILYDLQGRAIRLNIILFRGFRLFTFQKISTYFTY